MPSGSLISIPASPPAPASFDWLPAPEIVGSTIGEFDGRRRIADWGSAPREISFSLPPLTQAQAVAWLTFIGQLKGSVNYFTLTSAFTAQYPELAGINWRSKENAITVKVDNERMYLISMDCEEAF